jgi:hypothetical protein
VPASLPLHVTREFNPPILPVLGSLAAVGMPWIPATRGEIRFILAFLSGIAGDQQILTGVANGVLVAILTFAVFYLTRRGGVVFANLCVAVVLALYAMLFVMWGTMIVT